MNRWEVLLEVHKRMMIHPNEAYYNVRQSRIVEAIEITLDVIEEIERNEKER